MSQPPPPGFDPSSFVALISGLGANAKILLGLLKNPFTDKFEPVDLDRARTIIGTLQMLSEKTRGNLADEEGQLLEAVLTDLQLRYVEKTTGSK